MEYKSDGKQEVSVRKVKILYDIYMNHSVFQRMDRKKTSDKILVWLLLL